MLNLQKMETPNRVSHGSDARPHARRKTLPVQGVSQGVTSPEKRQLSALSPRRGAALRAATGV